MFGWFKKKHEKPDHPKVYVTSRGGLYIKIEDLLASKAWDDLVDEMKREIQRSKAGEPTANSQRQQVGEREPSTEKS